MANSQKRVVSDIKDLQSSKEELNRVGIFYSYDEENMYKWKAVIMGTSDTPYEFGYHFFDITIPQEYPMKPPAVKYCTGDGRTRFNPNLYVEGKVCLSLLGTWHGPGWVPVYTMKTVLMTIQSAVLNEDPLINEPGYEKSSRVDLDRYNHIVEHQNIKVAIISQIANLEKNTYFSVFKDQIKERFLKDYPALIAKTEKLKMERNNKHVKSPIYGMEITTHYSQLLIDLIALGQKMGAVSVPLESKPTPKEILPASPPVVQPPPESLEDSAAGGSSDVSISVKKTKKTPNALAKFHDVGFVMESENHVVAGVKVKYSVALKSNGVKYWKKV